MAGRGHVRLYGPAALRADIDLEALIRAVSTHLGMPLSEGQVLSHSSHLVVAVDAGRDAMVVRLVAARPRLGAGTAADAYESLRTEVEVASHLCRRGVDVVRPVSLDDLGPHPSSVGWFTLWERADPWDEPIGLAGYRDALMALHQGLADCGALPRLGAWAATAWARASLAAGPGGVPDELVGLCAVADAVEAELAGLPDDALLPSHGDAHPRNLMLRRGRFAWNDFEDASLMPPLWDESCALAQAMLLGFDTELTEGLMDACDVSLDHPTLRLALGARAVNVTLLGCALTGLALEDHGIARLRVDNARPLLRRLGWT